ncbi:MAG: hypothetical protein JWO13_554 [Acidobacteriales bacterium]|nr:hypothetical protein [Terriglobales bacterium]
MTSSGEYDLLNGVKYLYLRHISEPRDNSLKLVVEEAISNKLAMGQVSSSALPEITEILRDASPIESIEGCRTFELFWKRYAAYLVTEEMVGSCGNYEDENYSGKIRIYDKSHLLDHLSRDTGGQVDTLQHYKIICLNHLIDVAAYSPPEIRIVEGAISGLHSRPN